MAGQPFTVSEYNHSGPSDYQAEVSPFLAAIAAIQDWDAIYLFDYNNDRDTWNSNKIRGFFAIDSNPAKMALLPAAAMMFLRGDVPAAKEEVQLAFRRTLWSGWWRLAKSRMVCGKRPAVQVVTASTAGCRWPSQPAPGPVTLFPAGKAYAAAGTSAVRWQARAPIKRWSRSMPSVPRQSSASLAARRSS